MPRCCFKHRGPSRSERPKASPSILDIVERTIKKQMRYKNEERRDRRRRAKARKEVRDRTIAAFEQRVAESQARANEHCTA